MSEPRKRETALVILVATGAVLAAAYHYVGVHWPWLLGEPARERIGALVRCEPEALELEAVAVPSAVTWPAAPVYDALRLRVRPAGGVLGHELATTEREGAFVVDVARLPDPLRAPLRACAEREQSAIAASVAAILARPGDTASLGAETSPAAVVVP